MKERRKLSKYSQYLVQDIETDDILGRKIQKRYRFPNGYGASVIRGKYTYGGPQGRWEVAVLKYYPQGVDDWELCYTTPITSDVLGHLTWDQVLQTLELIKALKK